MKWIKLFTFFIALISSFDLHAPSVTPIQPEPVRMAVAGLSHGHAHWIFQDSFSDDIPIVGIYEPNRDLARRFIDRYNLDESIFYDDLEEMLDSSKPEGLLAFGPVYNHLEAVEAAAPRGIHVMVEKPLAVSMEHANKMKELAVQYEIHLLTNYETSWYPSTEWIHHLTQNFQKFGKLRKAVFYHGHQGPREIGVGPEFLEWLTDPELNGGGALTDFGCYGANIMTYLTAGQDPVSVMAVVQTHKPQLYPEVDDEATIIITYPESQAIIQASWNWPYNRKDMEIYGEKSSVHAPGPDHVIIREPKDTDGETVTITAEEAGIKTDPFLYFAGVIRGNIQPRPYGLYTLENNMMVVKILEAAKISSRTGKRIDWKDLY